MARKRQAGPEPCAAPADNIHGLKLIGPHCPPGAASRSRTLLGRYDAIGSRAVTRPRPANFWGVCAVGTIGLPVSRKALRAAPAELIAADTLGDRISQFTGDRTECSSSERARWALVLVDRGLAGGSRLNLMKVAFQADERTTRGHPVRYPLAPPEHGLERNPRQRRNQDHHDRTEPAPTGRPEGGTTEMRRLPPGADDRSATSRSHTAAHPRHASTATSVVLLAASNVLIGETWFRSAAALILD
jgi:hypothetical protein